MDALIIRAESPAVADVTALLQRHFELMRSTSPAESCHVMAPDSLSEAGATLLAARDGERLLGVGALAPVGPGEGELKSMHTTQDARGRGIGRQVLLALLALAREQGMHRVSLETGTADAFAAARALYLAEGFEVCPPFGDYRPDPLSVFMTRPV